MDLARSGDGGEFIGTPLVLTWHAKEKAEEEDGKVEISGNEKGKNGKGVLKKKSGRERR